MPFFAVRLVTPDGTQVHDLAPSAPAVTLGSWSPSGRQLGITIFGGGTGDGSRRVAKRGGR